ncbi:hypothetical protein [Dyella sp. 20L07]|uniref:hypothetical protein n=1 Tax=Dyella sp. 20L07 TaxID=3384240 RepID=UPI003D28236A
MDHSRRTVPAQLMFALTMMALGILGFIYGDVALVWQHIPIEHLPWQRGIAYGFATIELVTGIGLLSPRTARLSSRVLFAFLLLWVALLKLPAVLLLPQLEFNWLGLGEIMVIFTGAWMVLASTRRNTTHSGFLASARGVRLAHVLFALSLPMIGLSHFFYSEQTLALVPAWLPFRLGWAYLTGAASVLACLGVLFAIYPRLAATLEAGMLGIITLLVWVPAVVTAPTDRTAWTALVISTAIACGAWLVADSYRHLPWRAIGSYPTTVPAR